MPRMESKKDGARHRPAPPLLVVKSGSPVIPRSSDDMEVRRLVLAIDGRNSWVVHLHVGEAGFANGRPLTVFSSDDQFDAITSRVIDRNVLQPNILHRQILR